MRMRPGGSHAPTLHRRTVCRVSQMGGPCTILHMAMRAHSLQSMDGCTASSWGTPMGRHA
eukprot:12200411-Prorocentrum_lima.AAC.1